jgi:hypothetical protein
VAVAVAVVAVAVAATVAVVVVEALVHVLQQHVLGSFSAHGPEILPIHLVFLLEVSDASLSDLALHSEILLVGWKPSTCMLRVWVVIHTLNKKQIIVVKEEERDKERRNKNYRS